MLQSDLYPTVGLQTPGETIDANFGQAPFVYDIEDMMRELRARVRTTIQSLPVPDALSCWQETLHRCGVGVSEGIWVIGRTSGSLLSDLVYRSLDKRVLVCSQFGYVGHGTNECRVANRKVK